MSKTNGTIVGVNGNMISVNFDEAVSQNEVGYALLGDLRLMAEVVRVRGTEADMQVFEDTKALSVGDAVDFTGELLSAELGPGLLTQIYDGLQNPLPQLAEQCGFFLQRGTYLDSLPRDIRWAFTGKVKVGDTVTAGETLGTVPEGLFEHRIMVPFKLTGRYTVDEIMPDADYVVTDIMARLKDESGNRHDVTMM